MLTAKGRLAWQVGWRFLRARNHNGFVSFISLSSVIGVALGVMVLILVLSAMNGFERELKDRLLAVVPHAEMKAMNEPIVHWPEMVQEAQAQEGVVAAAPFVLLEGMLQKADVLKPVALRGVLPEWEGRVSDASSFMDEAAWQSLHRDEAVIVLGSALAEQLNVTLGDRVSLLLPRVSVSPLAGYRTQSFTVTGLFDLGGEIDRTAAFTNLRFAAKLGELGDGVSGVRLRVEDLFAAPQLIRTIGFAQTHALYLNDWTRTQGHLYSDIQLIRTLTYLVLVLVVAVASFNIICSLVMSVRDKQAEIAILRTMGMAKKQILTIFMVQGALTGLLGCGIGAALGVLLAWKLSDLMAWFEQAFGVTLLSGDIYFIDFLPSELHWQDVGAVTVLAFLVTLVATWYPAWQASRLQPAQVL